MQKGMWSANHSGKVKVLESRKKRGLSLKSDFKLFMFLCLNFLLAFCCSCVCVCVCVCVCLCVCLICVINTHTPNSQRSKILNTYVLYHLGLIFVLPKNFVSLVNIFYLSSSNLLPASKTTNEQYTLGLIRMQFHGSLEGERVFLWGICSLGGPESSVFYPCPSQWVRSSSHVPLAWCQWRCPTRLQNSAAGVSINKMSWISICLWQNLHSFYWWSSLALSVFFSVIADCSQNLF